MKMKARLEEAIRNGSLTDVKELIEEGVDINEVIKDNSIINGYSPLMFNIYLDIPGSSEISKLLIEAGADINIRSENGETALSLACYHNNNYIEGATPNKDIINLLIENGADVNARSLYRAINQSTYGGIKRTPDTINVLLDAGVDIHGPIGFHGDNALLAAAREQYSEAVEILLQHGADINSVNDDKLNALHLAIMGSSNHGENYRKTRDILITNGIDINAQDKSGMTPLMCLCKDSLYGDIRKDVDLLNKAGVDICIKNHEGKTALDIAEEKGDVLTKSFLSTLQMKNKLAEVEISPGIQEQSDKMKDELTKNKEQGDRV